MEGLSPLHLIMVLAIAVLVVGPGKLPEVGAALGKTIREFRKAASDMQESARLDAPPVQASAAVLTPAQIAAAALAPEGAAHPPAATEPGTAAGPTDTVPPQITPTSAP